MKAKRLTWQALAALASLCLTLTASATPPMPLKTQSSPASETETGYVISLRGSTLTLSNISLGNRGGGGGAGPRIVLRSPDGSTRELTGAEAEQAMQRMQPGGGGTRIEVSERNGKRTYTLTGPDGKTRTLTQEEFEKFQKKMESEGGGHSGGRMMVRSTDGGPPPPAHSAQPDGETIAATKGEKNIERKKVRFSRFAVTDQTSKPDGLARGTKVKVQYRLEGGKKIATKIAIVME